MPIRGIRDLRDKIKLLMATPSGADQGPRGYPSFDAVAHELGMHKSNLTTNMQANELPARAALALLTLFELDGLPEALEEDHPQFSAWSSLLREPLPAFKARVSLMGGNVPQYSPGEHWLGFEKRHAVDSSTLRPGAFFWDVVAPTVAKSLAPAPSSRALLPGQENPFRPAGGDGRRQTLAAGSHARLVVSTRDALPHADILRDGVHLLLFQDVVIDARRHYMPIVPGPQAGTAGVPNVLVRKSVVMIPDPDVASTAFEIPFGWAKTRKVIAVLSPSPPDAEVVDALGRHERISEQALDLLAARLTGRLAVAGSSPVIWSMSYEVDEFARGRA